MTLYGRPRPVVPVVPGYQPSGESVLYSGGVFSPTPGPGVHRRSAMANRAKDVTGQYKCRNSRADTPIWLHNVTKDRRAALALVALALLLAAAGALLAAWFS